MTEILEYISNRLNKENLRHEIHKFDSGAVMIDIWKEDSLYVVQIEGKRIGLSLVTEDTGIFETIPDKWYDGFQQFTNDFEKLF